MPLNDLGYGIELVPYDDQAKVEIGVANAQEIVANPEILCGVGHFNSRVMIQASEIYHKEGLSFVSPSNTSTTVTERGYLEVNRVVGRDDGQGIAGAQFARAQNFINVYIITQDADFTRKISENFKREADRIGVKVVGMLTFNTTESFDGIIKRMMIINPDLVYLAGTVDQVGPLIRQARAVGYTGTFLGIDSNPALVDLAGPLLIEGGGRTTPPQQPQQVSILTRYNSSRILITVMALPLKCMPRRPMTRQGSTLPFSSKRVSPIFSLFPIS